MEIANTILLIVGVVVVLIGVAAFLNPNLARFVNFPGGPRLKAVVAIIVGVVIVIVGLFVQLPS